MNYVLTYYFEKNIYINLGVYSYVLRPEANIFCLVRLIVFLFLHFDIRR